MSRHEAIVGLAIQAAGERSRPTGGPRFDAIIAILSAWMVIGLYVDGWSHRYVSNLDSFFNPWHAMLYSGLLAMVAFLTITVGRNARKGLSWRLALPLGHGKTAVGLALFAMGGVSDMIWHLLFGFEGGIDILFSPSHLLIFTGMALTVSGPLRAAWHRPDGTTPLPFLQHLPMLASVTLLLSMLTFVTMFLHPYENIFDSAWLRKTPTFDSLKFGGLLKKIVIASVVVQTVILMSLVLVILKRWRLPFGSLTLILTFNALLLGFLGRRYLFILLACGTGLASDLLLLLLHPTAGQVWRYRLFAFSVPTLIYAVYFLCLARFMGGVGWSVHLVAGTVLVSGLIGLLISYAVFPPELPGSLAL